jgi:hypothetical protein
MKNGSFFCDELGFLAWMQPPPDEKTRGRLPILLVFLTLEESVTYDKIDFV